MIILRALDEDDEPEARRAQSELALGGVDVLREQRPGEPSRAYVARLELMRHGRDLPPTG